MTPQEKDRIECAIRHIQTAVDVDPWAVEIAVEAMKAQLSREDTTSDLISKQAAIDRINKQREHLQPDIYPQDKIGDAAYRICAEFIERLPSAQPEPLTGKEQRIFLAAMGREEKICEEVDRNYVREPYEDSLVRVCKEIRRKVKGALWT